MGVGKTDTCSMLKKKSITIFCKSRLTLKVTITVFNITIVAGAQAYNKWLSCTDIIFISFEILTKLFLRRRATCLGQVPEQLLGTQ